MITYKTETGRVVTRADYGDTRARVLSTLAERPWITRKEIGVNDQQLKRMRLKGLIKRRPGARKHHAYEYALPDAR